MTFGTVPVRASPPFRCWRHLSRSMPRPPTPAATMASYNDGVVAIMKAKLPIDGRVSRFEKLVGDYYDMPGIAQLVVGPKWATAIAGRQERPPSTR